MIPTFARILGATFALALSFPVAVLAQGKASEIPVETFMRRAENQSMSLSPDGQLLAALTPLNGRDNLVVVDLKRRTRTVITAFTAADVSTFQWLTSKRIFFRVADGRDVMGQAEFLGSYAIDVDGSHQRQLGNMAVLRHKSEDEVYAAYSGRRRDATDVYVVNTRTGVSEIVTAEAPAETRSWVLDWKGVPRAAVSVEAAAPRSTFWYRADEKSPWQDIMSWEAIVGGVDFIIPLAFEPDGKTLIVTSNVGRDRAAIFRFDPATRKLGDVLFEHPLVDLEGGLVLDQNTGALLGLRYDGDRPGAAWVDERMARLQTQVDATLPKTHNALLRARDSDKSMLVFSQSDVEPGRYFLLNREPLAMEELLPTRPWLKAELMSERRYMPYKARDGLTIPAWVVIPRGSSGKDLPLVVHVHGGPWTRSFSWNEWSRYSEGQFFASRGYAVLEAEPRASTGFGRKHLTAGFRQWGQAMQDDLTDGIEALVKAGIVDRKRVCIYGGSYGGYAALWGPIKDPGLYRCAVPWIAATDLALLQTATWSDTNRSRMNWEPSMRARMGSARDERAMLDKVSPYLHADRIKVPVLLAMGSDDRRVPIEHGTKMRDALDRAGVKHEFHVYTGEGHGLNKDANIVDFFRRVEKFLAEHLK